ncbi:hypothetical protein F5884DRAFT_144082 [Xylogone sp. PMI_703]|nr:hypothetical protein F5884DRAFT_144082 [Xylogone sp. PMI_703]
MGSLVLNYLKTAENHFSPEKPEFSIQLIVEDSTLDVLKDLLSRRGEGYVVHNPLKIKVPEAELLSDSFSSGDPFPDGFDGTSTTDTDDGPKLPASAFTPGDKVAVQAWFGCYNFNNRTGPTFRLLKLWKLQPSFSGISEPRQGSNYPAQEKTGDLNGQKKGKELFLTGSHMPLGSMYIRTPCLFSVSGKFFA